MANSIHGMRRELLLAAAGCAVPGHRAFATKTVNYPERPVRQIIPYAPEGGPDLQARVLAKALSQVLGQPVVAENKVGAGGILAADYVCQQPPDGYTLLQGASTHITQKLLQPAVRFDPARFTHIMRTGVNYSVLVVSSASPYHSVQELAHAAKRSPATLIYASGGIGSAAHLYCAAFTSAAELNVLHIPYRGSVDIAHSLIRGDTQFAFPTASTALPQIRDGKLRALAITAPQRSPLLVDIPTLNQALQRSDLGLLSWSGIWGPPGLPESIVARLHSALVPALRDPGLREAYARDGATLSPSGTPAEFSRFIENETQRYHAVISDNQIVIQ